MENITWRLNQNLAAYWGDTSKGVYWVVPDYDYPRKYSLSIRNGDLPSKVLGFYDTVREATLAAAKHLNGEH